MPQLDTDTRRDTFIQHTLIAVGVAVCVLFVLLVMWYAVEVFFLIFASILLAIFLRGLADLLSEFTSLSSGWSLALVIGTILCLLGFGFWFLAPEIIEQINQLTERLPASIQQLLERVEEYAVGQWLLGQAERPDDLVESQSILTPLGRLFSTTLGILASGIIVLVVGLYLAISPGVYVAGFVRLIPKAQRPRARAILRQMGHTLQWWIIGRFLAMIIISLVTALGLWLLDVPLALTFGLLSGLLTFVPNIGPIVATIPPALLALTQDAWLALYVVLLYLAVQGGEGYLITPLVQQRTVALPPALTIISQLLLGVLAGVLGIIVAMPLAVVVMVLVKMLLVEGDPDP